LDISDCMSGTRRVIWLTPCTHCNGWTTFASVGRFGDIFETVSKLVKGFGWVVVHIVLSHWFWHWLLTLRIALPCDVIVLDSRQSLWLCVLFAGLVIRRVKTDCLPSTQLDERLPLALSVVIMDHETTVANAISMCSQPLIGRILHYVLLIYSVLVISRLEIIFW